jgi:transposase-like protein
MTAIICKNCQASSYVKNGQVRGRQRYRCNACGCNFTDTPLPGKPAAMKALALLLYGMGNMSYRMIARLLRVSHVSVDEWSRSAAEKLPEPARSAAVLVLSLDEMHHFLKKERQALALAGL